MKKKILTLCLALVAIIGISLGLYFALREKKVDSDGFVTIEVIDVDETLIKSKKIAFKEGDSLIQIVKENFENVEITEELSPMIMKIETIETTSDWSKFISIYVNDEASMEGISQITFKDGDKISFVLTEFIYE